MFRKKRNPWTHKVRQSDVEFLVKEFPHHKDSSHATSIGMWAPSDLKVLLDVFKKIKLSPHHRFLDAGSGDGRVVFLASLFCGEAVGIEADPVLHFISSRKLERYPHFSYNTRLVKDNYLNHNLADYDIIFNYADGEVSEDMRQKCMSEMRPGTKAIFYIYHPKLPNTKMLDKKTPIWFFEK